MFVVRHFNLKIRLSKFCVKTIEFVLKNNRVRNSIIGGVRCAVIMANSNMYFVIEEVVKIQEKD